MIPDDVKKAVVIVACAGYRVDCVDFAGDSGDAGSAVVQRYRYSLRNDVDMILALQYTSYPQSVRRHFMPISDTNPELLLRFRRLGQ